MNVQTFLKQVFHRGKGWNVLAISSSVSVNGGCRGALCFCREAIPDGSEIIVSKSLHTKSWTNQRSTWHLSFNIPKKYACNCGVWPSLLFVDVDDGECWLAEDLCMTFGFKCLSLLDWFPLPLSHSDWWTGLLADSGFHLSWASS